jgi:hypothetical protein
MVTRRAGGSPPPGRSVIVGDQQPYAGAPGTGVGRLPQVALAPHDTSARSATGKVK